MAGPQQRPSRSPDPRFLRGVGELNARRLVAARRLFAGVVTDASDDAPWAAQELIQSYLRRDRGADAEPHLRALIPAGSAHLDHALGYLFRRSGRASQARPLLERAAASRPRLWAASNELGYVLCRTGAERRGLAMLRAAERHFAASGDDWGRAIALVQQGTHALHSFRLLAALRDFERATELRRAAGDRFGLANVRLNVGVVLYCLADYRRAIEAYDEATQHFQSIGERYFLGMALNGSGLCRLELAETHLATNAFRAALSLFRRVGDRESAAGVRTNLGYACRHRRDLRGAIRYYRAALVGLAPVADDETRSVTVVNLAEALSLSGRSQEAIAALATIDGETVSVRTRVLLSRETARAELGRGEIGRAIAAARDAIGRARRIPGPQQRLITHWVPAEMILGRALLVSGRRREALRTLRRCAGHLENLLLSVQRGASDRIGLLETYRSVHDAWLLAVLAADRAPARRAWRLAARLKARELRHAVVTSRRGTGETSRVDESEAEVRRLLALPALDRAQAARLRALRLRFVGQQGATHRGRRDLPAAENALASLLRDGETALIEYHVASEASAAFLLTAADTIAAVDLGIGERWIERAVEDLVAPLRAAGAAADPQRYLQLFDRAAAGRLHRRLLAPLLARIPPGISRLIIVPDGPLHGLPFEVLIHADTPAADPLPVDGFLIARYAISYSQSSLLLRPPRLRAKGGALLLGFSPPAGTVVQGALGPVLVGPLLEAGAELDAVADRVHSVVRLEHAAATADAFAAAAPACSIIHIAAHAMSDPQAPGLSGIVVAPRSSGASADFLTGERLSRMRLAAELVTLSACDGGRGRLRAREGIFGLSRAFTEAGVDAVLASLWPVDDRATRRLMTAFYAALGAGNDRARALAIAKRSLLAAVDADAGYRHPYFWAGFVLVDHRPEPAGERRRRRSRARSVADASDT